MYPGYPGGIEEEVPTMGVREVHREHSHGLIEKAMLLRELYPLVNNRVTMKHGELSAGYTRATMWGQALPWVIPG